MTTKPVIELTGLEIWDEGHAVKMGITSGKGPDAVKATLVVSLAPMDRNQSLKKASPFFTLKAAIIEIFSLTFPETDSIMFMQSDKLKDLYTFKNKTDSYLLNELANIYADWSAFKDWLGTDQDMEGDVKMPAFEGNFGKMIDELFHQSLYFDLDSQFDRKVTGEVLGCDFSFTHKHVLGNHFIDGRIETVRFRILKNGPTIILYVAHSPNQIDLNIPEAVFLDYQETNFEATMYNLFKSIK